MDAMSDVFEQDKIQDMPTFEEAIQELSKDRENLPSPTILYGLSGLTDDQLSQLRPVWNKLDATYRRILMQMLVDVSETNFELNYNAIGYDQLKAPEPEIRQAAIEVLWEDNTLTLMQRLIDIARKDPALEVRREAVRALGRFVLMGELGELDEDDTAAAQAVLFEILNSEEPLELQRHALESIANCSRADVVPIIREAYASDFDELRRSAIIAMGHTCDTDKWEAAVLEELKSPDEAMQMAAVKAAGELQISEAVMDVVRILGDSPREVQEVAIEALGEIGGKQAIRALEAMLEGAEDEDDDELLTLLEDAIGNASLMVGDFLMMDFTEGDELDADKS